MIRTHKYIARVQNSHDIKISNNFFGFCPFVLFLFAYFFVFLTVCLFAFFVSLDFNCLKNALPLIPTHSINGESSGGVSAQEWFDKLTFILECRLQSCTSQTMLKPICKQDLTWICLQVNNCSLFIKLVFYGKTFLWRKISQIYEPLNGRYRTHPHDEEDIICKQYTASIYFLYFHQNYILIQQLILMLVHCERLHENGKWKM